MKGDFNPQWTVGDRGNAARELARRYNLRQVKSASEAEWQLCTAQARNYTVRNVKAARLTAAHVGIAKDMKPFLFPIHISKSVTFFRRHYMINLASHIIGWRPPAPCTRQHPLKHSSDPPISMQYCCKRMVAQSFVSGCSAARRRRPTRCGSTTLRNLCQAGSVEPQVLVHARHTTQSTAAADQRPVPVLEAQFFLTLAAETSTLPRGARAHLPWACQHLTQAHGHQPRRPFSTCFWDLAGSAP